MFLCGSFYCLDHRRVGCSWKPSIVISSSGVWEKPAGTFTCETGAVVVRARRVGGRGVVALLLRWLLPLPVKPSSGVEGRALLLEEREVQEFCIIVVVVMDLSLIHI